MTTVEVLNYCIDAAIIRMVGKVEGIECTAAVELHDVLGLEKTDRLEYLEHELLRQNIGLLTPPDYPAESIVNLEEQLENGGSENKRLVAGLQKKTESFEEKIAKIREKRAQQEEEDRRKQLEIEAPLREEQKEDQGD